MSTIAFQYVFGPVYSWRLGYSLGVDPISDGPKICNFDCTYCQLGKTVHFVNERRVFVPTQAIVEEIKALPSDIKIDFITFSGRGETTLAANLGEVIDAIKAIRKEKIAIITNSTLFYQKEVRQDCQKADVVLAKLDVSSEEVFEKVNKPIKEIRFQEIVQGLKDFRREYKGKFGLQVMFVKENKKIAPEIAELVREIVPDEVELNTPLRPSAVQPLSPEEMRKIKKFFTDLPIVMVYEKERKKSSPFDVKQTQRRHGRLI